MVFECVRETPTEDNGSLLPAAVTRRFGGKKPTLISVQLDTEGDSFQSLEQLSLDSAGRVFFWKMVPKFMGRSSVNFPI